MTEALVPLIFPVLTTGACLTGAGAGAGAGTDWLATFPTPTLEFEGTAGVDELGVLPPNSFFLKSVFFLFLQQASGGDSSQQSVFFVKKVRFSAPAADL